jgi:hypothetical protein
LNTTAKGAKVRKRREKKTKNAGCEVLASPYQLPATSYQLPATSYQLRKPKIKPAASHQPKTSLHKLEITVFFYIFSFSFSSFASFASFAYFRALCGLTYS